MKRKNCKKLIPNNKLIKSADNQLYNSGVFMKERHGVQRNYFNNPYVITFYLSGYSILIFIQLLFTDDKYKSNYILLGD